MVTSRMMLQNQLCPFSGYHGTCCCVRARLSDFVLGNFVLRCALAMSPRRQSGCILTILPPFPNLPRPLLLAFMSSLSKHAGVMESAPEQYKELLDEASIENLSWLVSNWDALEEMLGELERDENGSSAADSWSARRRARLEQLAISLQHVVPAASCSRPNPH